LKLLPGNIVPINYDFWPEASNSNVMAMVVESSDDWVSLCPVHTELEAACFMDYVITPAMSPLKMLLVVVGELIQPLPRLALNQEFIAGNDSARIAALAMPDDSCKALIHDLFYVLAHTTPQEAFKVSRGRFLPSKSRGLKFARDLAGSWASFVLSAWRAALIARGFKEKAITALLDEIIKTAKAGAASQIGPLRPLDVQKRKKSRPLIRSAAGRIGILTTSRMGSSLEADKKVETEESNKDDTSKRAEISPFEAIKKTLAEHLIDEGKTAEATSLAEANLADFLKLLLRLFPQKNGQR